MKIPGCPTCQWQGCQKSYRKRNLLISLITDTHTGTQINNFKFKATMAKTWSHQWVLKVTFSLETYWKLNKVTNTYKKQLQVILPYPSSLNVSRTLFFTNCFRVVFSRTLQLARGDNSQNREDNSGLCFY